MRKTHQRKARVKHDGMTILLAIGFAIAAAILLYPSFMESVNNMRQTSLIGSYEEKVDVRDANLLLYNAAAYNRKIAQEQAQQSFTYQGENADDKDYEKQLSGTSSSTIGFLEIKKIHLYLPVMHGTKTDDLNSAVGHMYGTSLPIPTGSTHAVLAAHTGLQSADLFTNLTKLDVGDTFRMHVLGAIYIYKVTDLNVVLPEEEDPYLQIKKGQDLITLYTCTPYGVNDHRLLVRGRFFKSVKEKKSDGMTRTSILNRMALIRSILFGSIPPVLLILGVILSRKPEQKQKKGRKKKHGNQKTGTKPQPPSLPEKQRGNGQPSALPEERADRQAGGTPRESEQTAGPAIPEPPAEPSAESAQDGEGSGRKAGKVLEADRAPAKKPNPASFARADETDQMDTGASGSKRGTDPVPSAVQAENGRKPNRYACL